MSGDGRLDYIAQQEHPANVCKDCEVGEPHACPRLMPRQHQLDGTKKPAALLHVETDVDVVLDALARWHGEQSTDAHPGGFDLCPASPCRDVREAL